MSLGYQDREMASLKQTKLFGPRNSIVDDLSRLSGPVTTYSTLRIARRATVCAPKKSAGRK